MRHMQFTYRQWSKVGPAFVLWVLITLMCALSGPFGTIDALTFGPRLAYWATVVGASVLGSVLIDRLELRQGWQRVGVWVVFAVVIAGGVYLFNGAFFGGASRAGGLLYLTSLVGATVLAVHGLLWLARTSFAPAETPPPLETSARFQRRLPLAARGALVRIEAQDHYLNVVTDKGSALILMRLSEAIEALEGVAGLQVHRSHWVAMDAVRGHKRKANRDLLEMSDGSDIPVARNRRQTAKGAGLF